MALDRKMLIAREMLLTLPFVELSELDLGITLTSFANIGILSLQINSPPCVGPKICNICKNFSQPVNEEPELSLRERFSLCLLC